MELINKSLNKMPEKGPFGEFYPYHHHLHNPMLNGSATNGLINFRGSELGHGAASHNHQQQQSHQTAFSASTASGVVTPSTSNSNSLQFPSAFVAFHNSQLAAAQQRQAAHESSFNQQASFHYPLSHG